MEKSYAHNLGTLMAELKVNFYDIAKLFEEELVDYTIKGIDFYNNYWVTDSARVSIESYVNNCIKNEQSLAIKYPYNLSMTLDELDVTYADVKEEIESNVEFGCRIQDHHVWMDQKGYQILVNYVASLKTRNLDMITESIVNTMLLESQIDQALANRDKEEFMRLTAILNGAE